MSTSRLFQWLRLAQRHFNHHGSIGTVSTLCVFGASVIESVDENQKKTMIRKRRRKKTPKHDTDTQQIDSSIPSTPPSSKIEHRANRIMGHYNNRIRQMSTPEKIFSTFASIVNKRTGQQMMTFNDFCQAILPYDFRNDSSDKNINIPQFFNKLIVQNRKRFTLSLSEFIVITSLLSIPPSDFDFVFKIFDIDKNERMDASEFIFLLDHFKQKNTSNYDVTDDNVIKKTNIWRYLFGSKQEKQLTLIEFQDFLFDLRESILRMEYERYCGDIRNKLSAKNFAMSLVSYAHHRDVSYYVARVSRMPKYISNKGSITYAEFIDFNKCLFQIHDIMKALRYLDKGGEITQKAFHHTVLCITGIDLNKDLVNIMFWVLDRDANNTLDQKEIQALLTERFQYGQATDRIFLAGMPKCFKDCFAGK